MDLFGGLLRETRMGHRRLIKDDDNSLDEAMDNLDKIKKKLAALRQQIIVLKRSVKRAKIEDSDRIFWILMRRIPASWRDTLIPVELETVISVSFAHAKWRRKGFGYYWHRKSQRGKSGRPPIDAADAAAAALQPITVPPSLHRLGPQQPLLPFLWLRRPYASPILASCALMLHTRLPQLILCRRHYRN